MHKHKLQLNDERLPGYCNTLLKVKPILFELVSLGMTWGTM